MNLPGPPEFAFATPPKAPKSGMPISGYSKALGYEYSRGLNPNHARIIDVSFMKQATKYDHEYLVARVNIDGEVGYLSFERIGGPVMEYVDSEDKPLRQYPRNPGPFGLSCSIVDKVTGDRDAWDLVKYLEADRLNSSDEILGRLNFENPPRLYELAFLASLVHERYDYYTLAGQNCYFYSGFLFDLLRKLPGAVFTGSQTGNKRLGYWKAFVQSYAVAAKELDEVMSEFSSQWQREDAAIRACVLIFGAETQNMNVE